MEKSTSVKFEQYLDNYLKVYWLRPVTSLARALEAVELGLENDAVENSADLACGDGLNSFVARGGTVPFELDAFRSVPLPPAERFFSDKVDVYDFDEKKEDIVIAEPKIFYEYGLDHKQALLNKSAQMKCYKKLILQDLNKAIDLPDNTWSFVFCNSLYWMQNLNGLLKEIYRVMKPGATAKFVFVKDTFADHMALTQLKGFEIGKLLDMGRHYRNQQLLSQKEFEKKLNVSGLNVDKIVPMFNKRLVHMIEFHDYREISPITSFMSAKLSKEDYKKAKTEWISYMKYLYVSMYKDGMFTATEQDSNYNIYFVHKPK